ncbi:MAG: NAD(P)-binding domain-containing protein [Acidobacteriia bacterium]|nr:NAD(P)-binding domain-containing protein [Terriglobia bacterium]
MQDYLLYGFYAAILLVPLTIYINRLAHREKHARQAAHHSDLMNAGPRAQHPHVDVSNCIGCQGCTTACPEGGVLGMIGGKAAVVRPQRCIGHGLCAEACPVGAITLVMASPGMSADLPFLTPEYETSVANLFIAGELGGLALIKNAVQQGRDCIDTIAARLPNRKKIEGVNDVIIVGAGPAGISASLRAIERHLDYLTIERETVGGAVAKYPRQKMVMATRVEFPLYGPLKKMEFSKEHLLDLWNRIGQREDFRVTVHESVEAIRKRHDGLFSVTTPKCEYLARAVVLAMGRSGTPRTLGVEGEDLPKVMYRLLEADHYVGRNILVVGGGDSAVEAAMGLARQKGNRVTLSYRRSEFVRLKERNAQRIADSMRAGAVNVIFDSAPVRFTPHSAILEVAGEVKEIPNDFVWIFAGGVAPNDFLKRIGVAFGSRDLTDEVTAQVGALCSNSAA